MPLVNALRDNVRKWREAGYPGATNVTRDLLLHWWRGDRARRLFFCQLEAVETIIYLAEICFAGRRDKRRSYALSHGDLTRLLRGERRMDYVPDPATGLLTEEYVDVYGIPFSVIPSKGRTGKAPTPEDRPKNHVRALPERQSMEMRFPVVEGYTFALRRNLIHCNSTVPPGAGWKR